MFIIGGRRTSERFRGRIAEYCSACSGARPMRVWERVEYSHLYFIPVSRFESLGFLGECESCKRKIEVDPNDYLCLDQRPKASLEALVDRTNPGLVERLADWLDLADTVRAGEGTAGERLGMLVERATPTVQDVQSRGETIHLDHWGVLAVFAWIGLAIVGLLVGQAISNTIEGVLLGVLAGVFGGMVGLSVAVVTERGRFARRRIASEMVPRLTELNPTVDDIEMLVALAKAERWKIARHLEAGSLYDSIRAWPEDASR